jgi:L-ectoine synthase
MIVRTLKEVMSSEHEVKGKTWVSRRLLLEQHGLGFSLHDTIIRAGTETPMWYRHHVEAVYCIEGKGTLMEKDTGKVHAIEPGTVYALDKHDRHVLRAESDLRLICVFNPPLHGAEQHDAEGGYALAQPSDGSAR